MSMTETTIAPKRGSFLYLGPWLFMAAVLLAALAIPSSMSEVRSVWEQPTVPATGGFTLEKPVVWISITGVIALLMLIAAIILTMHRAVELPSSMTASIIMGGMILGVAIFMTPQLVSHSTIGTTSSQNAFNQWSNARYGVDTSTLSKDDRTLLMKTPSSSKMLTSKDLRTVKLPDGQLIQAISDESGARYLVAVLGNELPVIARASK